MHNLAENLKRLRKIYGYSQEYIGEMINIDRSSYAKYELGLTEPSIRSLIVLADIYNVTIDSLVGREFKSDINKERLRLKSIQEKEIDNAIEIGVRELKKSLMKVVNKNTF